MSDKYLRPKQHLEITPGADKIPLKLMGIYVGTAGNVTATLDGVSAEYVNVPAGKELLGEFTHVTAASAGDLVALAY